MITVHHLNNSRSQRILWLLEELGVPHEIRHYQRDAVTMRAPPELAAVHPLGKSPLFLELVARRVGGFETITIAVPPILRDQANDRRPNRPFVATWFRHVPDARSLYAQRAADPAL